MLRVVSLSLLTLLSAAACSTPEEGSATEAPAGQTAPPPSSEPAGLPPVSSRAGSSGPAIVAPGASFRLPAAWEWQTPSSSMRLAQAGVPGAGGPGQLTVFYFGPGGGGGVEANLDRWAGQVEPTEGGGARRESFAVGPFQVTWIEVAGTLKPSTMGVGPTEPQPGSRLLAAVVEGDQGPWFFKLTGPDETLAAQRGAFLEMLQSAEAR